MFFESSAQQYWLTVPSPTTKLLWRCQFIDTVFGWACGDSGVVIHTSDGGVNWTVQNTGIIFPAIEDICFTSRFNGWALANDFLFSGTIMLRTTNGGLTWTNYRFPDTTLVFNTIYFLDSLRGFLTGYSGKIFKTTNGGNNWYECNVDTAYCSFLYLFPKWRFGFLNSMTGYIAGGQIDIQGMIWQTTDGGNNWFTYCVTPEPLYAVKPINSLKVISTGGDFEYGVITAQSYNAGFPWIYDTTTCFGVGRDLAFRTPSELWIPSSFSMKWAVNLDSGSADSEWFCIDTPDSISVYAAQFVTPTFGFGFGANGKILKYNPAVISVSEKYGKVPSSNILYQNYPNPFNSRTVIRYRITGRKEVSIRVFDVTGREIMYLYEGIREAGEHLVELNLTELASGLYFYQLSTGDFYQFRKMVLLK